MCVIITLFCDLWKKITCACTHCQMAPTEVLMSTPETYHHCIYQGNSNKHHYRHCQCSSYRPHVTLLVWQSSLCSIEEVQQPILSYCLKELYVSSCCLVKKKQCFLSHQTRHSPPTGRPKCKPPEPENIRPDEELLSDTVDLHAVLELTLTLTLTLCEGAKKQQQQPSSLWIRGEEQWKRGKRGKMVENLRSNHWHLLSWSIKTRKTLRPSSRAGMLSSYRLSLCLQLLFILPQIKDW